jgi:hypothetical protein
MKAGSVIFCVVGPDYLPLARRIGLLTEEAILPSRFHGSAVGFLRDDFLLCPMCPDLIDLMDSWGSLLFAQPDLTGRHVAC